MKNLVIVTAIVLHCSGLFSQSLFTGHIGGADAEIPSGMVTDNEGNIILFGVFDLTVDFDMGAGVHELTALHPFDGYIAKYDSLGNFIWATQYGAYFSGLTTDADNNIYAAGYFSDEQDLDPSAGEFLLASNGLRDAVLLKLNADANFIWAEQVGSEGDDSFTAISSNKDGSLYTTGSFSFTVDFDPSSAVFELTPTDPTSIYVINNAFIAKYTEDGSFVWAGNIASAGLVNICNAGTADEYILVTAAGVSATSTALADFDPDPSNFVSPVPDPLPFAHYMGIIKYDAEGNYIWSQFFRTFGSLGYPKVSIYDLQTDAENNIYITGSYLQSFAEYPDNIISLEPFGSVYPDGFLIKLTADAELIWQKRFGSGDNWDYGANLALDADGNIHLTGGFVGTAEFNETGTSETLTSTTTSVFDYDLFLTGYDTDGNFLYKGQVGSVGSDAGYFIHAVDNRIILEGIFANVADCDPLDGEAVLTSEGYQDIFLNIYRNEWVTSVTDTVPVWLGNIISEHAISVYPNPCIDHTVIYFGKPTGSESIIEIYDLAGNKIKSYYSEAGILQLQLAEDLEKGMYIVHVSMDEEKIFNEKIVVQ